MQGSRYEKRKEFWTLFITVLISALLVLLNTNLVKAANRGKTLRFGAENEFAGFEVLKSTGRLAINGSIAANTIMETLFRMDAKGNLIPVLGLSATSSSDGKLWTVKLRKGVTFHDGSPFNADAVVHHWGRILNPENKYRGRAALAVIVSVDKINDYTVGFRLKHPWLLFLRSITDTRGLGNLIPSPQAVEQGTQNRQPIGTGPFMLKEWKSGDRFIVVKNPNYWQKNQPYLDAIVFRPLPDHQTRYASLQSGQVDIIWMDRGNLIKKARKDASLNVMFSEDNGAEIFILNTVKPPLDDVNVRRALAHANNQALQVKMVYQDSIPIVHHPFGKKWQCPDDGYREYNLTKAKQLIGKQSSPLALEYLHSNSKRGRDIGELTQQLLKDIGVDVVPVGLNFGPVVKKVISGNYQVSTWRMSSRADQGNALFVAFHSKSRGNFSHYQNPEMDKLLMAQRVETDPAKRKRIMCAIARLINQDVPIIYRGGMRSHVILRKEVHGITEMNNGIVQLRNAWIK